MVTRGTFSSPRPPRVAEVWWECKKEATDRVDRVWFPKAMEWHLPVAPPSLPPPSVFSVSVVLLALSQVWTDLNERLLSRPNTKWTSPSPAWTPGRSGFFKNLLQISSLDKGKIKTASIVRFALRYLVTVNSVDGKQSLFNYWNGDKNALLASNDSAIQDYVIKLGTNRATFDFPVFYRMNDLIVQKKFAYKDFQTVSSEID